MTRPTSFSPETTISPSRSSWVCYSTFDCSQIFCSYQIAAGERSGAHNRDNQTFTMTKDPPKPMPKTTETSITLDSLAHIMMNHKTDQMESEQATRSMIQELATTMDSRFSELYDLLQKNSVNSPQVMEFSNPNFKKPNPKVCPSDLKPGLIY
ncbi:unnamed protein product [Microthlaspi erraticum]|uniref:Uncharacterized protein n=1 Tax=Microthlaspi erraticum TaxID=1685480 RepID=A0A6D2HZP0_9BRAS|nr:unnamed protein product [Microthlaspi erraticum]